MFVSKMSLFKSSKAQWMLTVGRAILFLTSLLIGISLFFSLPAVSSTSWLKKSILYRLLGCWAYWLVWFISLSGVLGAITRSSRCLIMFAVGAILLALVQSSTTFGLYLAGEECAKLSLSSLIQDRLNYTWHGTNNATMKWDRFQDDLKCCGLEGRFDWNEFRPDGLPRDLLPASCCTAESRAQSIDGNCHFEDAYKAGCESQLFKMIDSLVACYFMSAVFCWALVVLALVLTVQNYSAKPPSNNSDGLVQKIGSCLSQMSPA